MPEPTIILRHYEARARRRAGLLGIGALWGLGTVLVAVFVPFAVSNARMAVGPRVAARVDEEVGVVPASATDGTAGVIVVRLATVADRDVDDAGAALARRAADEGEPFEIVGTR